MVLAVGIEAIKRIRNCTSETRTRLDIPLGRAWLAALSRPESELRQEI